MKKTAHPMPVITKIVTPLAHHSKHGYLVYVQTGDIPMEAVVNLADPELTLYVDAELIETGNSLAWLSRTELLALDTQIALHKPTDRLPTWLSSSTLTKQGGTHS